MLNPGDYDPIKPIIGRSSWRRQESRAVREMAATADILVCRSEPNSFAMTQIQAEVTKQ